MATPQRRRVRCLFCGASDLSKEDVLPKWLSRELRQMGVVEFRARSPRGEWTPSLMNIATRKFCQRECNGGWMSRLEKAAKPLLMRTVLSPQPGNLTPADQQTLASWAYKTVLTSAAWHDLDPYLPGGDYAAFYAEREPPDQCLMLMGLTTNREFASKYSMEGHVIGEPREPPQQVDLVITSFTILHGVFATFRTYGGTPLYGPNPDPFWLRLWPALGADAMWPIPPLTDTALDQLFPRRSIRPG